MKSLHFTIIGVLCLIFAHVVNVSGMASTENVIQLLTGKSTYVPGEKIQIIGASSPDNIVHIDLVNPFDGTKNSTLVQSDSTGQFRTSYIVPKNAVNGTWTILATSGIIHTSLNIQVISSNPGAHNENMSHLYGPGGPIVTIHLDSPLRQFRHGTAPENVTCWQEFQLIFKIEDNSPACVKESTAQRLVKYGWGTLVPAITEQTIPTLSSSIMVSDTNFIINYDVMGNGKMLEAKMDSQSKSLILSLETAGNGTLTVSIPRELIDVKKNDRGMGQFYMLDDGQETNFKEVHTTSTERIFSIPFQNGTSYIEIIATELI